MTRHSDVAAPAANAQVPVPDSGKSPVSRLLRVDLARGFAVFGMYAAHVGPDPGEGGKTGFLMEPTHGRSSALFALLAGFAIVIITGRGTPKTGQAGRQAVVKVVVRAVILLAGSYPPGPMSARGRAVLDRVPQAWLQRPEAPVASRTGPSAASR